MPETTASPENGEYTIDELSAKTGIPSRTIRFYQAKGVLASPRKRGRVAVYDNAHVERLELVNELQDKGCGDGMPPLRMAGRPPSLAQPLVTTPSS